MPFVNINIVKQLKDCTLEVSQKKCKNALAQMFSVELSLAKQAILFWFNEKIKSQHLEIDKCLICNFPLKIGTIGSDLPNNKMYYGDFFIRCEHKFLRNIYRKEQLASAPHHQNIERILQNIPKIY